MALSVIPISSSITGKLVRSANSEPHPNLLHQKFWGGTQKPELRSLSGNTTLKFKDHWAKPMVLYPTCAS